MIDRVRDIHDGLISVEKVADAAEHQKLVKRPPRDLRVKLLLKAKTAFLQKLPAKPHRSEIPDDCGAPEAGEGTPCETPWLYWGRFPPVPIVAR